MESQNQTSATASPLTPQVVGNAFVHQYYNILYQSPEQVHKFYQEHSRLGRPEAHGVLSSVTTLQAINEKILSMDYHGLTSEIKTVDAQESLNGGVLVLVTGYLTENDNVKRKFTQSFFLATQDKGFFVLNDIFRYMDEDSQQLDSDSPQLDHESQLPQEEHVPTHYESPQGKENSNEEVHNTTKLVEDSVAGEETMRNEFVNDVSTSLNESESTLVKEEEPKKSYASILRIVRENIAASASSTPTAATVKSVPSTQEKQTDPVGPVLNQSNPEIPAITSSTPHTSNIVADGFSVYIKGLPLNITAPQLEKEFQRFGPIRPGGVQVRSPNLLGFCFGFIEFETAEAFQNAIEASPVMMGGCQVHVEAKRPSRPRVSNSRGMASGRMGGFRNEGGRGRGQGGRSQGRGSDFRGRSRGGGSHGEAVVYQRVEHTGLIRGVGGARSRGAPPRNAAPV